MVFYLVSQLIIGKGRWFKSYIFSNKSFLFFFVSCANLKNNPATIYKKQNLSAIPICM